MNMNQREDARIEFAGMAMQALIPANMPIQQTVQLSVEFADALIAELQRTEVRK